MGNKVLSLSFLGALLSYVFFSFGPPAYRSLTVLGALRWTPEHTFDIDQEIVYIPDATHCEDLHYYAPANLLFTACEDNAETRFKWFPPLTNFDDPEVGKGAQGSIRVVDAKTMKSQRLKFDNFNGTFVTHGIDVITDPKDSKAVYIFAINHVPSSTSGGVGSIPRSHSRIEVFHHTIGSLSIKHIRSVWHPLIRTPNDVFANSPTSIYVTNDHRYADHGLMRTVEDLYARAKWTDVVHLTLDLSKTTTNPITSLWSGVDAKVVMVGHNTNGLGHGKSADEILVTSAASGVLHIGKLPSDSAADGNITVVDSIEIDSVADNPGYFSDPFASSSSSKDYSGFLLPGVAKGIHLSKTQRDPAGLDPITVWYVRPVVHDGDSKRWEKRLLFADDGSRIRSASAAVLVAIDPKSDIVSHGVGSTRKAWLFVTGFLSSNIMAVKVDL